MYKEKHDLKLSIIVPAYNCENTIEKCVKSILQQNNNSMEIVIINDGSKDRTLDLLIALAEENELIKVLNQNNVGVSATRNRGVEEAKGQYVMFIDADDEFEPEMLVNLISTMDKGYDYIVANYKRVISNKEGELEEFIPKREKKEYWNNKEIWNDILRLIGEGIINAPWGKVFRREILIEHKIKMDTGLSIGEDLQFNLEYLEYVEKALILPDVIYLYNTQNSILTTSYKENMFQERKKSIEGLRVHLENHNIDTEMINFLYCKLFFSCIMQEHGINKGYEERKEIIKNLLQLDEIKQIKRQYFPTNIQGKLLLNVINSENSILIDIVAYLLLLIRNKMKKNVGRVSV